MDARSQGAGMAATNKVADIKRVTGSRWKQAAQDLGFWNSLQKTYVQQW
ncbi:jg27424, partial [Pararge aegeria aegeria]